MPSDSAKLATTVLCTQNLPVNTVDIELQTLMFGSEVLDKMNV